LSCVTLYIATETNIMYQVDSLNIYRHPR